VPLPNELSSLYAWYRADSYALGDGATISGAWTDKTGGGRSLNAAGSPIFRAAVVGNQPAVDFNGSAAAFSMSTFGWEANLASHTLFVVFQPDTAFASANAPGMFGSSGGDQSEALGFDHATKAPFARWANTGGAVRANASAIATQWHFAWKRQNGPSTSIEMCLDGGGIATQALSGTRRAMGSNAYMALDGGSYFKGQIAEVFVFSAAKSAAEVQAMVDYVRSRYFVVVPRQNEQERDVLSRRLWALRRAPGLLTVEAPLWALDLDVGDRVALQSRVGPSNDGKGWLAKKWQRHDFTIQQIEDLGNGKSVRLQLLDRRPLDALLWDTASTDIPAVILNARRQSGVARFGKGSLAITFARASRAWVENPADPTAVMQIQTDERALTAAGEYLEPGRINQILRSSFASGTTGITLTGTGVNGSAIAVDTSDLLFDPESSPNSLKFTAGSPHTALLYCTFPVTATIPANSDLRLSIDHHTDSGEALFYWLSRGVDGQYWNAGVGWQVGSIGNQLPTVPIRSAAARYVSPYLNPGFADTTLTLSIGLASGGTAGRISHLYHAQIELGLFATSRMLSDATAFTRSSSLLSIAVPSAARVYEPALGSFYAEVIPEWTSWETYAAPDRHVYYMTTNGGADYDALYYQFNIPTGQWVFERKVGASVYTATHEGGAEAGSLNRLCCRWTGAEGELGLAPYTMSVFWNGEKGTDAVSVAPTFAGGGETLYLGQNPATGRVFGGVIRNRLIRPYAPTDEEMGRTP